MFSEYSKIAKEGLWFNNQAFVALLGLCPLLAVSNTVINGLGLGLATALTLMLTGSAISLIRKITPSEVRLPIFVLVIACVVTIIELAMNAWFFDLYKILGIFISLIVTNCSVIGRAEAFASKHSVPKAMMDGLFIGLGFTFALTLLGSLREIIGSGTFLAGADLMFGPAAKEWKIIVIDDYSGVLLAILPPGAFIGLGFLIALKNVIDAKFKQRKPAIEAIPVQVIAES